MTVRVYRWDDASAPTLTGQNGSLTALLKAVLVTGYGSKPAAGWSNPYSATNIEAFTNSTATGGSGYGIKVSHGNPQYANVVAYESIDGSGVTTNTFPSVAQLSTGVFWHFSNSSDTTQRAWLIAADEKRFFMWVNPFAATSVGLVSTGYCPNFFTGDIASFGASDPYRFTLIGAASSGLSNNNFAVISLYVGVSAAAGHYIARTLNGVTISKPICKVTAGYNGSYGVMGSAGLAYPDPASGGMVLSRVGIGEADASGQIRGFLPGIYNPLHNLPGNPGDTFSGVGPLAGKTFLLLDSAFSAARARIVLETSDTWGA